MNKRTRKFSCIQKNKKTKQKIFEYLMSLVVGKCDLVTQICLLPRVCHTLLKEIISVFHILFAIINHFLNLKFTSLHSKDLIPPWVFYIMAQCSLCVNNPYSCLYLLRDWLFLIYSGTLSQKTENHLFREKTLLFSLSSHLCSYSQTLGVALKIRTNFKKRDKTNILNAYYVLGTVLCFLPLT